MDKKKIKTDYLIKIKLINKYNKFYYDQSNPIVNDQVYDDLKKEILVLEKNSPDFTKLEMYGPNLLQNCFILI